jgi:tetratricopeptide (TPR) repeat protein
MTIFGSFEFINHRIKITAPLLAQASWGLHRGQTTAPVFAQQANRGLHSGDANALARVMGGRKPEYAADHRNVTTTLTNFGNAYGAVGDASRQRDLLERALAIKEREYGADHWEVAITLGNLGNADGALGDAARQRDLLERALAIAKREFGAEH